MGLSKKIAFFFFLSQRGMKDIPLKRMGLGKHLKVWRWEYGKFKERKRIKISHLGMWERDQGWGNVKCLFDD